MVIQNNLVKNRKVCSLKKIAIKKFEKKRIYVILTIIRRRSMNKLRKVLLLLFLVLLSCVLACQNPSDTKLEEVTFSNMVTSMKEGDTLVIDYLKQENVSVKFESSDLSVATVEENVITAISDKIMVLMTGKYF